MSPEPRQHKLFHIIIFLFVVAALLTPTQPATAQNVAINSTGNPPDAKAMLDVSSTTTGLLIPRMTQVQRDAIATPTTSLLIYQTDATPGYYYYNGSIWVRLFSGAESSDWSLTGNAGTSAATNFTGTTDAVDWVVRTNNAERLRVLSGGNVGIGTAAPGSFRLNVLEPDGAGTTSALRLGRGNGDVGILFEQTSEASTWSLGLADGYAPNSQEAFVISRGTSLQTDPKMVVLSGGNVGIGTTTPSYKLDVTGNTRTTGKFFGHLNVDDTRAVNDAPTVFNNEVAFEFKSRATVGVGGSGTYSGQITLAPWGDNSGDASHQLNFNEGGIFWRQGQPDAGSWDAWTQILTSNIAPSGSGTLNYLPKWTPNGATLGNSQVFDNGTNVGIGTATPGQKLDVNGRIRLVNSNTELYQSGTRLLVRSDNVDNVAQFASYGFYLPRAAQTYNLYLAGSMQLGYSDTDPKISYRFGDLRFMADANERVRITAAGNVGIGVTNPAYNLEIAGTFGYGDGTSGSYRSRTETRADAGQMATQSGFYQTSAPAPAANWYPGASSWQHLIDVRHSNNANNYAMQIAGSFYDQDIWVRKTNNSASTAWAKLVTSANYTSYGDNLGNHTATQNLNMANYEVDAATYYDVTAGAGYGLRFWSSNSYAINMGSGGEWALGPVTGYSIKSNMNDDATRGWSWGVDGVAPAAAINTQGHMQLQGALKLDCNSCGSTSSSWGTSDWGDMVIQGRVLSTNSNLHLSPPSGYNVIINDTYRAAGGVSTGVAGLTVEGVTQSDQGFNVDGNTVIDDGAGWHRTYGATGWYNGSYGGGWYMSDATWIRSYGGKSIYHDAGIMRTDGTFQVGPSGDRFIVTTGAKVGVKITSPVNTLDLLETGSIGTSDAAQFNLTGSTGGGLDAMISNSGNGYSAFEPVTTGTGYAMLALQQNTGVGSTALMAQTSAGDNFWGIYTNDYLAALDYYYASDRDLKENISPLNGGIDLVKKLNPVSYNYRKGNEIGANSEDLKFGFVAQEVETVFPNLVKNNAHPIVKEWQPDMDLSKIEHKYKALSINGLIPVLTKAIQEQQKIIEDQGKTINELMKRMEKLENNGG